MQSLPTSKGVGAVYLLYSEHQKLYKIGITSGSVAKRVKQLRTGDPSIKEVTSIRTLFYRQLEKQLHTLLKGANRGLEWFALTERDLSVVQTTFARYKVQSSWKSKMQENLL